jgi:hypothetical protein
VAPAAVVDVSVSLPVSVLRGVGGPSHVPFIWLFNYTHESVFYSLIIQTSLTVASVRLPGFPAHHA